MKYSILLALGFFYKASPHREGAPRRHCLYGPKKTPGNKGRNGCHNLGVTWCFRQVTKPIFDQNQKKVNIHEYTGTSRYVTFLPFGEFVLGKKAQMLHTLTLGRSRYVSALLKRLKLKDFSCHVGEVTRGIF